MNNISLNILALDVGARLIGTAVFENQRLVFYALKSIKKPTKADILKQLNKVLEKLAFDNGIQIIVLRKLVYPQQHNSFAQVVYKEIKKFANEKEIKLLEFEPLFVRQVICKGKNVSKHHSFEIITRLYPELSKAFAAKKIWQKMYYAYLFNAIAVGLVCVKELKENNHLKIARKNTQNERI